MYWITFDQLDSSEKEDRKETQGSKAWVAVLKIIWTLLWGQIHGHGAQFCK